MMKSRGIKNWQIASEASQHFSLSLLLPIFTLLLLSIPVAEAMKMYWTSEKGIHRADLDGGNLETILPIGLLSPFSIVVDAVGGKMYWTAQDKHKIQRADLNGANVEDIVDTEGNAPRDIAIDLNGGKIYWTATRPFGKVVAGSIHRANLNGTESQVVIMLQDLKVPGDIAVDASEGKIYWTMDNKIYRTNFNGTNREVIESVANRIQY